ncbi:MAG TPA: efflux RND transporter permease subunit [Roseateles sp.]|nr:efflux RND transporter permease subunit [Roseateles sp.]
MPQRRTLPLAVASAAAGASVPAMAAPPLQVGAVRLGLAEPEYVERDITMPLEQALSVLAALTALRSSSTHGAARLELEFDTEPSDPQVALVRETVLRVGGERAMAWESLAVERTPGRLR